MGHVEKGTRRIALHPHVLGARKASERNESTGLRDLGLVVVYDILTEFALSDITYEKTPRQTHHAWPSS